MKAYKKRIELLTKALKMCVDALDRLMGDTDLVDDDSTEFRAMQFACRVLDEIDEPHLDPLRPLITKEQIWGEALAEGKNAKDAFEGIVAVKEWSHEYTWAITDDLILNLYIPNSAEAHYTLDVSGKWYIETMLREDDCNEGIWEIELDEGKHKQYIHLHSSTRHDMVRFEDYVVCLKNLPPRNCV